MVKRIKKAIAFALALALLAIPAVAAGGDVHDTAGVYDLNAESGYTLTPLKADGTAPGRYSGQFEDSVSTVYEDAEKFTLSFAGSADQYVVFLLKDGGQVPTATNVAYIDQAGGGSVQFTVFPYKLEAGEYNVYLSGTDVDYGRVASFKVVESWEEAEYILGDVDQDRFVTAADASLVLQYAAQLVTLSETQLAAARVSNSGNVTAAEAALILEHAAGLISRFPAE